MRRALCLLLFFALPPAAHAAPAPDRLAIMSAASTSYAWDGQRATAAAPQQSVRGFDPKLCTKERDYYCDLTLVQLEAAEDTTAELVFDIFDFSFALADFDLSIFRSDATGAPGEFIANGGNLSAAGLEETVKIAEAEPGYYLVTVSYYFSPDASYKGTIKASGITPPPAPAAGAGPRQPDPAAAPAPPARVAIRSVKRSGRSVAARLSVSGTAENLLLALRDARGRLVASKRFASVASGTRTLKLRPARRLRRGRYTLTATTGGRSVKRAVRLP